MENKTTLLLSYSSPPEERPLTIILPPDMKRIIVQITALDQLVTLDTSLIKKEELK